MSLIVPPQLHQQFKLATTLEGQEMTSVLRKFIEQYVKEHLPASLRKNTGGQK
jgi:hypothetical protein